MSYHEYKGDLLADGFVSPMVLPRDRLKELQGQDSIIAMAEKCRIPTRELQVLMENELFEPNPRQLASISVAYQVSVFWLLGYHTPREITATAGDRAMLSIIGRRNAAELTARRRREKGFLGDLFQDIADKRVHKLNLQVSNTAARIIAAEHIPIAERELYLIRGQPVFIEYTSGDMEWGLVMMHTIQTLTRSLNIEDVGIEYQAFQTPNTAIKDFE